ncbi:hypothetical protein E1A91_A04G083200v1 [Gossypium mustelinum]|uniref:Uncharacterized protein n=1 Tax=Gossypium mustelinum TaxID=34275 RepID=A0A5D2ZNB6_GOSMU|nr:hypothetical protein E1A91_A04G083200v1 [Gossypium mustelinum]
MRIPDSIDHSWTDVCGGGCGFAMAISVLAASFVACFLWCYPAVGASRSLNRKQIKAQASRIANLLRKTDVSYLIGHYTIPKEMNEVCNWLTARLGLEG